MKKREIRLAPKKETSVRRLKGGGGCRDSLSLWSFAGELRL